MTTHTSSETSHGDNQSRMDSQDLQPGQDLLDYVKTYARQKPEVAALWCFGVGFIIGWKLKPW